MVNIIIRVNIIIMVNIIIRANIIMVNIIIKANIKSNINFTRHSTNPTNKENDFHDLNNHHCYELDSMNLSYIKIFTSQ